jgi:uncharacterized protein with von Willebrand factor type A (vWA) domain
MVPDLAVVAARLGAALRGDGVPVVPGQCERFASAVQLTRPDTIRRLYWCAQATLVSNPAELPALERAFQRVFGGLVDPATDRGSVGDHDRRPRTAPELGAGAHRDTGGAPAEPVSTGRDQQAAGRDSPYPALAAATERLAYRDFATLSDEELAELVGLMRRLRLAPPNRRTRRAVPHARGTTVDLRATLRQSRRTGGHPIRLWRRQRRLRPRRLVVLCDISGSMAPYARAMVMLLAGTATTGEVFTFATRLTRLTRALRRAAPAEALRRAGQLAPDWSGGTRIGTAVREFTDRYGARGMARGAVVVIVSDGWDTDDPAQLGRALARLRRLAYRIVWVNPRAADPQFQPLAGGMAAAWPYCDAVVSGHRLAAMDELLAAIAGAPARRA